VGIFPDLSEVTSKVVKVAEVIQPDPEWAAAYDRVYPFYVSMYQHLDEDLRRLEQVMQGTPTEPAAPAQGESRL
jgi:xylulokinase